MLLLKINSFFSTYSEEAISYTKPDGTDGKYLEYTREQHFFEEKIILNDKQI